MRATHFEPSPPLPSAKARKAWIRARAEAYFVQWQKKNPAELFGMVLADDEALGREEAWKVRRAFYGMVHQ